MIASRPRGTNSGLVLEGGGLFHVTSAGDGAIELELQYADGPPVRVRLQPHERRLLARLLGDEEAPKKGPPPDAA